MQKLLLLFLMLSPALGVMAQKTETALSLNTGLFSFRGDGAETYSNFDLGLDVTEGSTNNPYGTKSGVSFGLAFQVQRVTKNNLIIGFNLGYEQLQSLTLINRIDGFHDSHTYHQAAVGKTRLSNHFINGFPYLGYRIPLRSVALDFTGGLDLGYLVYAHEKGTATSANVNYKAALKLTDPRFDVRPRLQVTATLRRIGVYAGYAHGLIDYRQHLISLLNTRAYSKMIRFGVIVKLKD